MSTHFIRAVRDGECSADHRERIFIRTCLRLLAVIAVVLTTSCVGAPSTEQAQAPKVESGPLILVLEVEVFRLPEKSTWEDVVHYCAAGVFVPGDIAIVDRRIESDPPAKSCFRMRWLNGNPLTWEGDGCNRGRKLEICGVFAARNLVGSDNMPSNMVVDSLAEVGWTDEAVAVATREWLRAWASKPPGDLLEGILNAAMKRLPEPQRTDLHCALSAEAVDQSRKAASRWERHIATRKLITLGTYLPKDSSAAAFVQRLRDAGLMGSDAYTTIIRELRALLVAERAYDMAIGGDPDPIDGYLDEVFWSGAASTAFSILPSALIPSMGGVTTLAQKSALKQGAIEMQREDRRAQGIILYEALLGSGRSADAERVKREIVNRYPTKPLPEGDTPEEKELREVMLEILPREDLATRLANAQARATRVESDGATSTPQR